MVYAGPSKLLKKPISGITLLALAIAASPVPGLAQSPTIESAKSSSFSTSKVESLLALQPSPSSTISVERLNESYTLGPGDKIQIDIFNVPEYSGDKGQHQVLVDGTLNLPLIGRIPVQGLTIDQATNLLSAKYSRFLKRPILTVSLLAPRPLNIAVAGEVTRPGSYAVPLSSESGGSIQFPTLTKALQIAKGLRPSADVRQIQVRRPQGGSKPDQVMTVNLWEFLQNGDLRRDIVLRDGDSIRVPTLENINIAEQQSLADANFTGSEGVPLKVAVVGEVYRPGPYTLSSGPAKTGEAGDTGEVAGGSGGGPPTVTQAIQAAGGIKPMANLRQVQVRRQTRAGKTQAINVDLWKLVQGGETAQDLVLQEGDTISIPTATAVNPGEAPTLAASSVSPSTITINVVGEVKNPGAVQVRPDTPLNQGLLAAGGFENRRARKSEVDLVRLKADGTVSKRTLPVDFSQSINEEKNPLLRNGDVIVVNRSGLAKVSDTLGSVLSPVTGAFSILRILPF